VRFNIEDNPKADAGSPSDWNHDEGARVLRTHDRAIDKEARAQGVDPDLVRAIMYVENSGGDDTYFAASDFFERVGVADSIRPMNIKPEVWSGLGFKEEDFYDPEVNIEAAVTLIKEIQDRLDPKDQTPAKIGSIYNYAGRELVNDYGARVQDVYDKKLWTKVGLE
jgi:soluble lytic murein transglycosylase-like protein